MRNKNNVRIFFFPLERLIGQNLTVKFIGEFLSIIQFILILNRVCQILSVVFIGIRKKLRQDDFPLVFFLFLSVQSLEKRRYN